METNKEYLADLEKAIRFRCRCSATHQQTVFVHERTEDKETMWLGDVEVFDLTDCKDATRCYAWEDTENGVRIVTILHSRIVDSPRRAVQAALFTGVQRAMLAPKGDTTILMRRLENAKRALYGAQTKAEDLEATRETTRPTREFIFHKRQ